MKKIFFLTALILLSVPCFGGEWNLTGSLNQGRECFCSVILDDGRVLVSGGYNSGPLSSCEIYNPNTSQWSTTDSMSYARMSFSLTKLSDGKILATAGMSTSGSLGYITSEVFNPATETWGEPIMLNHGRYDHRATLLQNGRVLVVGGDYDNNYTGCEIYDPIDNQWYLTGFCTYPKVSHTLELLPNGYVMAIAGGNSIFNKVELYDVNNETWSELTNLSEQRDLHTSHQILPNGNVIVIGGSGYGSPQFISSCEIYNFATQQWILTDSLEIGRTGHCSESLLNNKILVMGGLSGQMGTDFTCEIYNPITNLWQTATSTYYPYSNFSSEILDDERVLAIKSWCEIYTWNYTPIVSQPQGPSTGIIGEELTFSVVASDPDGDSVSVRIDWGDNETSEWTELQPSGTTLTFSHSWGEEANYNVSAQVRDQWHLLNSECHNSISEWSDPVIVSITGTPVLQVSAESVNFGQVLIGSDSTVSIFISNSGDGTLEGQICIESPFSAEPENFLISPQGNDKEIFITFSPASTGFFEKILLIQSNDPENPEIGILLSGEGIDFNSVSDPVLNVASISVYPNPFNTSVTISFSSVQVRPVPTKILIFNIKGQRIRELKIENLKLKINEFVWDGKDENNQPVGSGIYFYKLLVDGKSKASRKMLLLK